MTVPFLMLLLNIDLPVKSPLASVSMQLTNGKYTVIGRDGTGKVVASWNGTDQTKAISWLNIWALRII